MSGNDLLDDDVLNPPVPRLMELARHGNAERLGNFCRFTAIT